MKSLVTVGLLILVLVALAPSVSACEFCRGVGTKREMCWSGVPNGFQSCYGGFGVPCTLDGPGCKEIQAPTKSARVMKPNTQRPGLEQSIESGSDQQRPNGGFAIRRD